MQMKKTDAENDRHTHTLFCILASELYAYQHGNSKKKKKNPWKLAKNGTPSYIIRHHISEIEHF